VLNVDKVIETENRKVGDRTGERGNGCNCLRDIKFPFCKIKRAMELDGDDGCKHYKCI
jgi:hypothetical protein